MEDANWVTGFNTVQAIYQSKRDSMSLAFIVAAYFSVLLLFWCLIFYMRTAANAAQRWKLLAAVWSLSTFLTAMFLYKEAELMPWPVALVVWGMAAAAGFGVFNEFFIHLDRQ